MKGGGGVAAGGEGALGLVKSADESNHAALLNVLTKRAGVVAGVSGGIAIVFAFGFANANEFNGYESEGLDFALSVGPKWSAIAKYCTRLQEMKTVMSLLSTFDGGLEAIENAIKLGKDSPRLQKFFKECPNAAKSVVSAYGGLVDTDAKNVVMLDVPMLGGGAELGVYYGWSKTSLMKQW